MGRGRRFYFNSKEEGSTWHEIQITVNEFLLEIGLDPCDDTTNSYHVHVTEQIDAFEKLRFESEFQALSPGGAISYVEVPNMQNNLTACCASPRSSTAPRSFPTLMSCSGGRTFLSRAPPERQRVVGVAGFPLLILVGYCEWLSTF